jgi:hypothetical protein
MLLELALILATQDGLVSSSKDGSDDATAAASFDDSAVPAQQKEQGKLFAGNWRCDGKANTELAADHPTKVTISFRNDLGPRWITVKIDEAKSKQHPKARSSSEVWGFVESLGGWVRNGADNQGGFYAGTSTGWVGDRFWWITETAMNGKKAKFKDTFTKVSDKELTFERAIDAGGDTYRVVYEGTCKK